ncbi:MAG: spore cortex biosynthesis protein YabQ [Ruminococcus sp.]|nr:spore cortex biosynthesis protein YabQ [Ruminococcus sp.]
MIIPETFFSVSEHLMLFFLSCLTGAFLGVLYDIFRILRIALPHSSIAVFLEDFLFCLIWSLSLMMLSSVCARGELRLFFAIGSLLGFILYMVTLGRLVIASAGKFISFFTATARFLTLPIRKLYNILYKKIGNIPSDKKKSSKKI